MLSNIGILTVTLIGNGKGVDTVWVIFEDVSDFTTKIADWRWGFWSLDVDKFWKNECA